VLLRESTRNRFGRLILIAAIAVTWAAQAQAHVARRQPACDRTQNYMEANRLFAESRRLIKAKDYEASLMTSHHGILVLGDHYHPPDMIEESDNYLVISGIEARNGNLLGAARIASGVLGAHLHDCEMMSRQKRRSHHQP
jgi:hypothetical protein